MLASQAVTTGPNPLEPEHFFCLDRQTVSTPFRIGRIPTFEWALLSFANFNSLIFVIPPKIKSLMSILGQLHHMTSIHLILAFRYTNSEKETLIDTIDRF